MITVSESVQIVKEIREAQTQRILTKNQALEAIKKVDHFREILKGVEYISHQGS